MSANGEHVIEHKQVTVVAVTYDHSTHLVSIAMKDTPIALVQMMVDEARRQLDILRRAAAAQDFANQRLSALQTQQILEAMRNKR